MEAELLITTGKILGSLAAIFGAVKAFAFCILHPIKAIKTHFQKFNEMHAELRPNGGNSLKDSVAKIEKSIARIERWQKTRLNHESTMFFDADPKGRITWVNKELTRQLRATDDDLKGYGYRSFICAHDKARVIKEIEDATEAEIDLRTHFVATDGRCFSCELLAVRLNAEIWGYTGVLTVRAVELCEK